MALNNELMEPLLFKRERRRFDFIEENNDKND